MLQLQTAYKIALGQQAKHCIGLIVDAISRLNPDRQMWSLQGSRR